MIVIELPKLSEVARLIRLHAEVLRVMLHQRGPLPFTGMFMIFIATGYFVVNYGRKVAAETQNDSSMHSNTKW